MHTQKTKTGICCKKWLKTSPFSASTQHGRVRVGKPQEQLAPE